MVVQCDFEDLYGIGCDLNAQDVYVFTNNDGEEVFYYRCEFHPVAQDEHIDEAMTLRVKPLIMKEVGNVSVYGGRTNPKN